MKIKGKKIMAITLTVLLLAGVTGCSESESPATMTEQTNQSDNTEEKTIAFNDEMYDIIGKTYGELKKTWGEPEGSGWYDGGVYFKFGDVSFVFEGVDDEKLKEPDDNAVCFSVYASLRDCVNFGESEEETCSPDMLAENLGVNIETQENVMDGGFIHTFEYKGITTFIHSEYEDEIYLSALAFMKRSGDC